MASKCEMSEPSTETLCEPPKRLVTDDSGLRLSVLRKKLVRRALPDHSQALRRSFQFLFLLLNVWLGAIFYAWVRHFETGANQTLVRPAGVEGWLPIAGLMNLKFWLSTGHLPATHPAALFLLLTFSGDRLLVAESILQLAVPGRNTL